MPPPRVHHSAIWVRDVDASLRFYRDGLGMVVTMDEHFDGDWPTLFAAPSKGLRSVMLGDPDHPDAGIVELVAFDGDPPPEPNVAHGAGFFLLSFFVDVDEVLPRLEQAGATDVRRIELPSPNGPVKMVTARDPDGVMVELISLP